MYDVAIIGSGPAGLTAAIYTCRSELSTLVVTGMEPGGQLTITSTVDNFPGFHEGIQGPELMDRMRRQAERFGAAFEAAEVTGIDFSGSPLRLFLGFEAAAVQPARPFIPRSASASEKDLVLVEYSPVHAFVWPHLRQTRVLFWKR